MPRRKELKGAAVGLLGAFVSRNNDVGGYWALGKLYRYALSAEAREIRVDLLNLSITPPGEEFGEMIAHYGDVLARQMAAHALPRDWLTGAEIWVAFTREKSADKPGDAFECAITLTDDRGYRYEVRESGSCWEHDAGRELRSARE